VGQDEPVPEPIDDLSALKAYGERDKTRLKHVWKLRQVLELPDFTGAEAK
jgi:hypothetical protein